MALGPGIIFAIVLNGGALLLGLLTYWYWWNTTSAKHVQQGDPVEIWCYICTRLSRAGRTYQYTFDISGAYRYFCLPHEENGLIGDNCRVLRYPRRYTNR